MGSFALLMLAWLVVFLAVRGKEKGKRRYTRPTSKNPEDEVKVIDERLDNRGYTPFGGMVTFHHGQYHTVIFGDKDFLTQWLEASSVEELQAKADPILKERHDLWLKRKARKKRRKLKAEQ